MELRRALLLFAVVLGLAAIATSISRPADRGDDEASDSPPARRGSPTAQPRKGVLEPSAISFSATGTPRTERLAAGRLAVVTVDVAQPGEVELGGLGLTAAAEPLTPARFDLLERRAGRYEVRFRPAVGGEARTVGVLAVVR
jgi:hypothetical protein